ncbi:MAG: hypothetical protein LC667_20230 [Thioalkalivibrio sp.]|nr:hypothetical protein [Thioalkalivibrio sp.]
MSEVPATAGHRDIEATARGENGQAPEALSLRSWASSARERSKQFPTGSWLEVNWLALPELMIEIELEAHRPG